MLATDCGADVHAFLAKPLPEHADLFEVALGWNVGLGTYFLTLHSARPTRTAKPISGSGAARTLAR